MKPSNPDIFAQGYHTVINRDMSTGDTGNMASTWAFNQGQQLVILLVTISGDISVLDDIRFN